MTTLQKIIKYFAIALGILITISIISAAFSIIGAVAGATSDSEYNTDEFVELEFDATGINKLNIDIEAAYLTIKTAETFKVETNNKYISCRNNSGILDIEEKDHGFLFSSNDASGIIIYIPKDIEFTHADISTGAGKIYIENLSTSMLELELGAGETEIDHISVSTSAKIEGGAGKLSVNAGKINDLDFDMGVGNVEFDLELLGNSELDIGIGNFSLNIPDTEDNYKINVNKGIGKVTVNEKSLNDGDIIGTGQNHISLNGGIGNITIKFN